MAPLPEYRGCNQFSFAILQKAQTFGTTLHRLEAGIDSGAILAERRFHLESDTSVQALYQQTLQASRELFDAEIGNILNGRFIAVPQEELVAERGTEYHARHEIEGIKQIDLTWPEEKIDRHIRATWFPPFEPPYALKNGEKITLSPNWRNELR
ncbi:MAG: hypothetical protein F6K11_15525 [Leptolyngbya sp. SIO3F4]|nr:hypothetical protein [Leptolyngbya sp. SIO3F4]